MESTVVGAVVLSVETTVVGAVVLSVETTVVGAVVLSVETTVVGAVVLSVESTVVGAVVLSVETTVVQLPLYFPVESTWLELFTVEGTVVGTVVLSVETTVVSVVKSTWKPLLFNCRCTFSGKYCCWYCCTFRESIVEQLKVLLLVPLYCRWKLLLLVLLYCQWKPLLFGAVVLSVESIVELSVEGTFHGKCR